ncbi:MAG: AI-2E family transporter [Cyclobacteriaceae bacterium]
MKELKTTNRLLLIMVIVLVFYLLKTLSFIFIPLIFAMFIALLFLPLMRWLTKKGVPRAINIVIVILIFVGLLKISAELIRISSAEILYADSTFIEKAETKVVGLVETLEEFFHVERLEDDNILSHYAGGGNILKNFRTTIDFISGTLSMTLTTIFFVILLLSGSINFQHLLNKTLFDREFSSIKTFIQVENDILKFVKVKFIVSLLTGVGFSLACIFFGVSFPIFWGLFAFLINFVQMVGTIVSIVLLSIFAFIELDSSGLLLFFIITIIAVQLLMGGVLEPVFMGQTFSLNVVTILIMLMLWGYIWGVPGLILSIPITVIIKIIFEQFNTTRLFANLMSGNQLIKPKLKKKKEIIIKDEE